MPSSQDSPQSFTAPCRDMSIDALGRVTNKIVAAIQALVSAPPPLGSKYADLLYSLHAAFGQGLAIIGGIMNTAAPINRIPPDLLTDIFALSPGAITHGSRLGWRQLAHWPFKLKTEIDVGDLHKLTKVCRYWRDLALATPMLWTTVGTGPEDDRRDSDYFRRSIYLPHNPALDLIVHFDPGPRQGTVKMIEFMLTNAPNIRELHVWDMARIPDVPSFWRSFDASALEHCTLWGEGRLHFWDQPSLETRFPPFFFNNGGARLRSLCLSFDFHILPTNEFPELTLLLLSVSIQSRITMGDLFKFLAGCPRLEELYIYNIQRDPSHTSPHPSPPISLPRLRYLSYAYRRHQISGWEEGADPIEYLLSRISIPSTCHMYFTVDGEVRGVTNRGILDSVCRHVQGKDAVSHLFLWLLDGRYDPSSVQLVFSQGSLRLQFRNQFDCVDTLHSFPDLFSRTEELRIRYASTGHYTNLVKSLARSLPATFPDLKVISLIPETWSNRDITAHLLHRYLAELPRSASSSESVPEVDRDRVPHPALDTLWVSVRSSEEIAPLEATLAARAALGFPIRCLIVHHFWSAGEEALARLRALDAEEVILTESRASYMVQLREVDWVVRLPEKFSLPAAIRRDWPTVWYRDQDAQDDEEE